MTKGRVVAIEEMADAFTAANTARKRRIRWWREHIALAYVVVIGSFVVVTLIVHFMKLLNPVRKDVGIPPTVER